MLLAQWSKHTTDVQLFQDAAIVFILMLIQSLIKNCQTFNLKTIIFNELNEVFYLMMHSTHFIYIYMASDI